MTATQSFSHYQIQRTAKEALLSSDVSQSLLNGQITNVMSNCPPETEIKESRDPVTLLT